MPNGKPGDSPLSDMLIHGETIFGDPTDSLVRELKKMPGYSDYHSEIADIYASKFSSSSNSTPITDKDALEKIEHIQQHIHAYRRLIILLTPIADSGEELNNALPKICRIFKKLEHADGSEYYLAELSSSVQYKNKEIKYIVTGARNVGDSIAPEISDLPVNIAYVTDESLLKDLEMNFNKGAFVGIAEASHENDNDQNQELAQVAVKSKNWWEFWK